MALTPAERQRAFRARRKAIQAEVAIEAATDRERIGALEAQVAELIERVSQLEAPPVPLPAPKPAPSKPPTESKPASPGPVAPIPAAPKKVYARDFFTVEEKAEAIGHVADMQWSGVKKAAERRRAADEALAEKEAKASKRKRPVT